MLSKNMSFSLLALATMMSFSTGYANYSVQQSLKTNVLKPLETHVLTKEVGRDVAIGLGFGAAGAIVNTGCQLTNITNTELKAGVVGVGAALVAHQVYVRNDKLTLKSKVTQASSVVAGCALSVTIISKLFDLILGSK